MDPEAFETPEQKLIEWLTQRIAYYQADVNGFAKALKERPGYAFDGCGGTFEAVAAIDVFTSVKFDLDNGCSLAAMEKQAIGILINRAIDPKQSSSATSNLYNLYKTKAWAEVAREARHLLAAQAKA